jgi:diguanylate cyclase (GGDEF)-like protein/PAS domain S-box-containing protein
MTTMRHRGWLLYILGGTLLLLGWEFVPPLKIGLVFNVIAFSSPVVIVLAVRTWRPEQRLPWYLFALGQTLFVAGDIITYNYEKLFGSELPYPSIGDILYLSVYPCLIAGVLLMVRRRSPGRDREGLIDSLIVAIGIGTISWVFLMSPIARTPESNAIQRLVGMAYPFMDLMLLVVVVRLAMGPGRRAPSFYLMAGAAMALFCTDFVYSYISVQGIVYNQAGYLEAGWASFYLLWGAAALHGSMRTLSDPAPDQERRATKARLGLLAGASLMAPAVQIIQEIRGERVDASFVIGASIALFLLVVVRMAGLVRREEQSAMRQKALQEAGQAFVMATDRDGIYQAAMRSAGRLAGESAAVVLLANLDGSPPQELTVVGASHDDGTTLGTAVNLPSGPESKGARLIALDSSQDPSARGELGWLVPMPREVRFVFVAPLLMMDELNALLCVGSASRLSRSTCDGLETLSSQAALALESAALTEDLLRRRSEARFSSLVQNSSDVVMVVAADSSVSYVSPSVERVLGHHPGGLIGSKLTELVHPEDKAQVLQFLTSGGRGNDDPRPALTEFRIRHRDEHWLHVESQRTNLLSDSNVNGIVLNTRDISERKAFEEQLQHQAFHDPVTDLANRALFHDRIEHALERQTRDGRPVSVLFMDLDDFKTINDSLGHAVGDRLLQEVGERLKNCLRAADTAARLGGDEFGILLEDGGMGIEAADVAARILAALEGPFHLGRKEVFVRASIGIATATSVLEGGPKDAEELQRSADVAMYMAKEAGKGRYQVFEPAMHDSALRRLELKADLQRAVDNGEFVLYYQPVIELETGTIIGLEALLRWNHPERGLVPPLDFIPLAEETGLIVHIGRWVIEEACRQAVLLQDRFPVESPLHMAVNLSVRQLQRQEIVGDIGEILMETGLDPGLLILEITESVMMKDVKLSVQRLTELKELGVKLAVDDFGTGYSSLNYIQQFPVDILKVDKSFVDAFGTDPRKSALTATIIKLASDLDLRPVAEGIERADQLERLLDLHCDLGQGFYFAKPLPMDGIDELLAARKSLARRETELSS